MSLDLRLLEIGARERLRLLTGDLSLTLSTPGGASQLDGDTTTAGRERKIRSLLLLRGDRANILRTDWPSEAINGLAS